MVDQPSPEVIETFFRDLPPEFLAPGEASDDPEVIARFFPPSSAAFSVDLVLLDDDGLIHSVPLAGRPDHRWQPPLEQG